MLSALWAVMENDIFPACLMYSDFLPAVIYIQECAGHLPVWVSRLIASQLNTSWEQLTHSPPVSLTDRLTLPLLDLRHLQAV